MNNGVDQIPISDLTENVRLLNKKREELFRLLEVNSAAIISSLIGIYERRIGVKVGSIVESGGDQFRVTDVIVRAEHDPKGKPWVSGNPKRTDFKRRDCGEWSTNVKNLFCDWELVSK